MTAAERRADLLEQAAKSDNLVAALLGEQIREVAALRDDLARREQRRLESAGAIPPRDTTNAAPRASSAAGATFPNYGRSKGQPVAGATEQDLEYYAAGARRSLGDPAKARFHDKERALLGAIEAELVAQRGGGQGPASANGAPPDFGTDGGDDDMIPFVTSEGRR